MFYNIEIPALDFDASFHEQIAKNENNINPDNLHKNSLEMNGLE